MSFHRAAKNAGSSASQIVDIQGDERPLVVVAFLQGVLDHRSHLLKEVIAQRGVIAPGLATVATTMRGADVG